MTMTGSPRSSLRWSRRTHCSCCPTLTPCTAETRRHPRARRIQVVEPDDSLAGVDVGGTGTAGVGTGGMVTKLEAARIATGAGIAVVLASAQSRRPHSRASR